MVSHEMRRASKRLIEPLAHGRFVKFVSDSVVNGRHGSPGWRAPSHGSRAWGSGNVESGLYRPD